MITNTIIHQLHNYEANYTFYKYSFAVKNKNKMENKMDVDEEKDNDNVNELEFWTKTRFGRNSRQTKTKYVSFEGKKYRAKYSQRKKYQPSGNKMQWQCTFAKCPGTIETNNNKIWAYKKSHSVQCDNSNQQIKSRKTVAIERMKLSVASGCDPRDAYNTELLTTTVEDYWGYREVSGRLYDVRRKQGIPELPECKEDIYDHLTNTKLELNYYAAQLHGYKNDDDEISESFLDAQIDQQLKIISSARERLNSLRQKKLSQSSQFKELSGKIYFGSDAEAKFQVFTDKQALKILADSDWILVDGTFKTTPRISKKASPQIPYDQVWIISAVFIPEDKLKWTMEALPCIYVLMPGKKASAALYSEVLEFVVQKGLEVGVDLSNCAWDVMADFEKAEKKAFEATFKQCQVYGCGFHYCQALMKNVAEHGLKKLYRKNGNFRYYIRKYMMLMLVPIDDVKEVWQKLKVEAETTDVVPSEYVSQFNNWFAYHETTWIDGTYSIEDWNRFGNDVGTNNLAESVNASLLEKLGKHPSLTKWITGIQELMASTIVRWKQLNKYGKTNWRSHREQLKLAALQQLAAKWESCDPLQYLEHCSKAMKFHFNSIESDLDVDLDAVIDNELV